MRVLVKKQSCFNFETKETIRNKKEFFKTLPARDKYIFFK